MKKIIALFLICIMSQIATFAGTLYSGSLVTVQPTKKLDADKLKEGELVDFFVTIPVRVDDKIVIKAGTPVTAQVTRKKNNFILGVPGALELSNFKIARDNGDIISLRGTVADEGENRYWVHIGWFFLFPVLFIKGDDGKIEMNTNHMLYTLEDIKF